MKAILTGMFVFIFRLVCGIKGIALNNKISIYVRKCFYYGYLRYHGVETKFGFVHLEGLPLIKRFKNSRIVLEEGITLISKSQGNFAGVSHPVILATLAEGALIKIEKGCGVSGAAICAVKRVSIGKNTGLGVNVAVYDTDFHSVNLAFSRQKSVLDAGVAPVTIGKNVWLSANAIILKGVNIGDNSVVGAGTVVNGDIPANTLAMGNPAEVIREIDRS